ncbi:MAG: hypothetical protein IPQ07_20690 [Myxococcales bacterium]|nr:hypothetical protein [Myxococcales bacterium]
MAEMILNKLLAKKDPAQRYQSMMDVEAALDSFVTQDGVKYRRSRPIPVQTADDTDVARNSDLIPRPSKMLDTPCRLQGTWTRSTSRCSR